MQVKHLMSENIITIDKDQNISDGLKLLHKYNISRLPVVNINENKQKVLVGIVSERDIAKKIGSVKYENIPSSRIHISSVMVKDVISVLDDMELADVASLMIENGIGSVPVESDETMVGIVSKADFVTLLTGRLYEKMTIEESMTKDIKYVSSSDRLVHARRVMLDSKVGRLPVIDDGELVGMVTSKDILRAFIDFKKSVPQKHQNAQIKTVLVEDIMSKNPISVSKDMHISDIAELIMDTGYNGFPVVEDDNVLGIITQTDLVKLYADLETA